MKARALWIMFMLTAAFAYGQDCCGPGGGGGAVFAAAKSAATAYRIRSARHYSSSTRHPGLVAGFEAGGITDGAEANISPRVEYAGSFGSFDLYGGAYYSVFFEKPHSHQADLAENVAWRMRPDAASRLVFRLDNEDLVVFFPEEAELVYAALEPSATYSRAFGFGDLALSAGLPVLFKPDGGLNAYFTVEYEHPLGLGASVCPRFTLGPEAAYSGTTVTLRFAWDKFFAKAAFVFNEDSSALDVRPYAEFTLGRVVFWCGVDASGIGTEDVSASPFIGTGYHF